MAQTAQRAMYAIPRYRSEEDLKRANEELQRFAATVSHDLREPLRSISAYARLLADRYRGKLDADADEFLAFITSGADSMSRLIIDLLEYSKASADCRAPVVVDTQPLYDEAVRNLRLQIVVSGAVIVSDPLPKVLGSNQLMQVFQNLIGNAIQHRAQRKLLIRVSAEPQANGYWKFSVADNGSGFDMRHAGELFNPFFRIHRSHTGTGMGLAICERIVRQLGGNIWAHSELGGGSTFFFSLPAAYAPASSASSSS